MIVVGIDPGLTGAVASLDAGGRLRHLHDTLAMAIRVGRQTRQDDDLQAMRRRPVPYAGASCHVCIEPQQAIPGQGVISLFKLGMGYGLWMALIATLQLLHTPCAPPWPGNDLRGFWAATRVPAGSAPTHSFWRRTWRLSKTMAEERRLHRVPRPPPLPRVIRWRHGEARPVRGLRPSGWCWGAANRSSAVCFIALS
jgi:hypothetical protein